MIKNKCKVFKTLKDASVVLTCLALTSGIVGGIHYGIMSEHLRETKANIRESDVYVQHTNQQSNELYKLYKSGEIDGKEYNRRMNALISCDDLEELKNYSNHSVIQKAQKCESEIENSGHACIIGLMSMGVTIPLTCMFDEKIDELRKKKEEEMEM